MRAKTEARSEDFERYVPYSVTHSSEAMGWRGFRVEVVRGHAPGEVDLPALDQHLLNVILAVPTWHHHAWDGREREEIGQEGAASLVPAGCQSRWRWHYVGQGTPCDFHMHMQPTFIREVATQSLCALPGAGEFQSELCFYQPQVRAMASALAEEVEAGGPNGSLYAESLATAMVALLLRRQHAAHGAAEAAGPQAGRQRLVEQVRTVCAYIDEHLADDLHLAALGELVGLGPERLRLAFHQALGHTPYRYVVRRRVEEARVLLRSTGLPITEIALRLGFTDHSHFGSTFRRETGLTPSGYRGQAAR